MASSEDGMAFDKQVLDVYLVGLEGELETKLHDVRRLRQGVAYVSEHPDRPGQFETVRALVGEFDRMLVTNRVVRETLLQLREIVHHLLQGLQKAKRS
jgi:hypothetical protein